jgi:hypothetical protein
MKSPDVRKQFASVDRDRKVLEYRYAFPTCSRRGGGFTLDPPDKRRWATSRGKRQRRAALKEIK